jgi:hypothetical protein
MVQDAQNSDSCWTGVAHSDALRVRCDGLLGVLAQEGEPGLVGRAIQSAYRRIGDTEGRVGTQRSLEGVVRSDMLKSNGGLGRD